MKLTTISVNLISLLLAAILLFIGFVENDGWFALACSVFFAAFNFILMIIYMIRKRPDIYISNMIWFIVLPVIGIKCFIN